MQNRKIEEFNFPWFVGALRYKVWMSDVRLFFPLLRVETILVKPNNKILIFEWLFFDWGVMELFQVVNKVMDTFFFFFTLLGFLLLFMVSFSFFWNDLSNCSGLVVAVCFDFSSSSIHIILNVLWYLTWFLAIRFWKFCTKMALSVSLYVLSECKFFCEALVVAKLQN